MRLTSRAHINYGSFLTCSWRSLSVSQYSVRYETNRGFNPLCWTCRVNKHLDRYTYKHLLIVSFVQMNEPQSGVERKRKATLQPTLLVSNGNVPVHG